MQYLYRMVVVSTKEWMSVDSCSGSSTRLACDEAEKVGVVFRRSAMHSKARGVSLERCHGSSAHSAWGGTRGGCSVPS